MPFAVVPSRDRTLHRLLTRSTPRSWEPGERLWTRGEPARACVQILSGWIVLEDHGRAVEVVGPGEVGGIEGVVEGATYRTTAVAPREATGVLAQGAAVLRALRRGIHTLPLLLLSLDEETRRARSTAAGAGGGSAETRLARTVLDLVERFGGDERLILPGVTHQLLGDLAGLHRSTVTTLLNGWIWEGMLEQEGRRTRVSDARGLVDRAGPPG